MRTKCLTAIVPIWLLLLAVVPTSAKVIYVDGDAIGLNDGSSWANAYNYLQDALADANSSAKPVEIRVGQGVYKPDQGAGQRPGDREATFQLINGVTVKGGFAGRGELDPDARDVKAFETLLSGDLDGDDVEVGDPYDLLDEPSRGENSYHVVTGTATGVTAILDGFTIVGGNADDLSSNESGGGMCNFAGSPTLTACTFSGNSAQFGGGMYNEHSSPTISNCTFSGNRADLGGGMCNWPESNPVLIKCTFSRNSGQSGGGGIYNIHSSATLTNCVFSNNHSYYRGGATYNQGESTPTLTNCKIIGNTAGPVFVSYGRGGGIYNEDGWSPILANCIIAGNLAKGGNGGGICNISTRNLTLANCTFVGNSASNGNAMACHSDRAGLSASYIRVINSILWDGGGEIWNDDNSTITITYSNVQGLRRGRFGLPGGNVNEDPCFVQHGYWDGNGLWVDGNYHLKSQAGRWERASHTWVKDDVTSPCIDTGDPNSPIGREPFPNGGIINMGAYGGGAEASKSYFGEPICETIVAGDINGDCNVDFEDLLLLALHWLQEREFSIDY